MQIERPVLIKSFARYITQSVESLDQPLSVRWEQLIRLIRYHRLEGCFLEALRDQSIEVSALIRGYLLKRSESIRTRQTRSQELFFEIISQTRGTALTFIPFKGLGLSLDAQIPFRLRPFDDLDLLISEEHAEDIVDFFLARGFHPSRTNSRATALSVLKNIGSINLLDSNFGRNIDLHLDAGWRYFSHSFRFHEILHNARSIECGMHRMTIPALSDHCLILLINGTKELWRRLDLLLELFLCVNALSTDDTALFNSQLEKRKLLPLFEYALILLNRVLFEEQASASVQAPRAARGYLDQIALNWRRPAETKAAALAHLALLPSVSQQIRYLLTRGFLATEADFDRSGKPGARIVPNLLRPVRRLKSALVPAQSVAQPRH